MTVKELRTALHKFKESDIVSVKIDGGNVFYTSNLILNELIVVETDTPGEYLESEHSIEDKERINICLIGYEF